MNRNHDTSTFQIRLRWSPNAFKGYIAALGMFAVSVLVSMCTKVDPPKAFVLPASTPVSLIFGDGDGTGARKGNLTQEGEAARGRDSKNPLQDAQRAAAANSRTKVSDPTQTARLIAVKDVGNKGVTKDPDAGADETIGKEDGHEDDPGLGWAGSGRGKGLGYSDLDWGGGGNRVVLHKPLPQFPSGTLNTEVRLKFRVRPDGTVSFVIPVRRGGNPAVDAAAMRAMYQWRFNPLTNGVEMEGSVTFVFRNS